MMLNVMVFAVIAVMTYTWWKQGFFSAAIHLVLTVVSGVLAFGIWDTVVYQGLIESMPEMAWGIGLLVPFAAILMVFRTISDKVAPGNLQVSPMANMLGGGVCGFASGVLVSGIMVIGLQMMGLPNLMGYTGWGLNEQGEPGRGVMVGEVTSGALILPVDAIAGSFLTGLSDGALSPLSSARSFGRVHPDIDVAAAFFAQGEFPESRKSIRGGNLSIADEGQAYYRSETVPEQMGATTTLRADQDLVVVGTVVMIQPAKSKGAADGDGIFRVKRPQVNLIFDGANGSELVWPYGYIQNGEYVEIKTDYIYSEVSSSVVFYWVFKVPRGAPAYAIQVKNTLGLLPEAAVEGGVEVMGALVKYQREEGKVDFRMDKQASKGDGGGDEPDISVEATKEIAIVTERLPFAMSVNQLGSRDCEYDIQTNRLVKGQAKLDKEKGVGRENGIMEFARAKTGRIVQVKLGANKPESLLGKVIQRATAATASPILRDDRGEIHMPVGYMIEGGGGAQFKFGLDETIRTLNQIPLARTSSTDDVNLIYHVGAPRTIISFELGPNNVQPLNLKVEAKSY